MNRAPQPLPPPHRDAEQIGDTVGRILTDWLRGIEYRHQRELEQLQRAIHDATTPPEQLLTIDEAARRLSTGVDYVRAQIKAGRLSDVKLGTNVRRVRECDIDRLVQEGTQ